MAFFVVRVFNQTARRYVNQVLSETKYFENRFIGISTKFIVTAGYCTDHLTVRAFLIILCLRINLYVPILRINLYVPIFNI